MRVKHFFTQVRVLKAVLLAVPASLMLACAIPSEESTEVAAEASKPMNTGEILQVVQTLNAGEIEQARLAQQKATTPAVRQTAERIIQDHRLLNQRLEQLAQNENVALVGTPLSEGLEAQASEIRQELAQLSGQDFDCTYLQRQTELHEIALDTVASELLPQAETEEVRELLEASRPALDRHQQAAELGIARIPNCSLPDQE